jgi:glycolate oxidase iron-sulfur subunit
MLEDILGRAGFDIAAGQRPTLCCGSAGSYSILQAATSERVLDATLANMLSGAPAVIATANIGCQLHMQSAADVPVVHWIELLDCP